jgi:23S rRNA pseudouridine955/2504/2580 synthase
MQTKHLEVDVNKEGQRIDNFLIAHFKNVPKSRIYRAIRSGEVRVNKKRAKQTYRLQMGDIVRIPPIQNYSDDSQTKQEVPKELIEQLENNIIHEDEYILVLNKPTGIAAHSGTGDRWGVIEIMRASRVHQPFLELVHRIDKETSGCLCLAKTRRSLLDAQNALQHENSVKEYTCLVKGQWRVKNKHIHHPIDKQATQQGAKMIINEEGKEAHSTFSTLEIFPDHTLIKASIDTGRTHQIRVHAQQEGYPLVGDKRYGDFEHNRDLAKKGFKRLFLHATYLKLKLMDISQNYEFTAPMPSELKSLCRQLRKGL